MNNIKRKEFVDELEVGLYMNGSNLHGEQTARMLLNKGGTNI